MEVSKIDEALIRVECDASTAMELKEYFTHKAPNFMFSPKYKAGVWKGDISLFNPFVKTLYRGLIPDLKEFATSREYDLEINDNLDEEVPCSVKEFQDFISTLNLPDHIEVRPYQETYCIKAIRKQNAILVCPTGGGKSLIAYMLQRYLNLRTLIIVPTVQLVQQMSSDFASYGYNEYVHKIYTGKEKYTNDDITISTWQSAVKMKSDWFEQFDMIIGDEAHEFSAKSMIKIMTSLVNCKYRIGTTGTLPKHPLSLLTLRGVFGEVIRETTTAQLIEDGYLSKTKIKCLILNHNTSNLDKMNYDQEIDYILEHRARNRFIKNLALSLKGNTLILFHFKDKHGHVLRELFKDCDRSVYYIDGDVDFDEREDIRAIIETEDNAILIASRGTTAVGINIKRLHNIIFVSPSKARIKILQAIGRGLRLHDTKEEMTLFDIADKIIIKKKENHTYGHLKERLAMYVEEEFPYKIYNIDLKD